MEETPYSARYCAECLSIAASGSNEERLSSSLLGAKIALNPHQIRAALFAFSHPSSKGVILADEVGLGKTIEAGLIVSQYWCERKRRILIITPASLMRQWQDELLSKFSLPSTLLNRAVFDSMLKRGKNPLADDGIYICSINFAFRIADRIKAEKPDLVVVDEAHKLRNAYGKNNVMARGIKEAIADCKKVLLTATPFQNSLMELFGVSTVADDTLFCDPDLFKFKYISNYGRNKEELRDVLRGFVTRTLREQVQQYVKYPKRLTHTFDYCSSEKERELSALIADMVTGSAQQESVNGRNRLVEIILRKQLSSSTSAVLGTLRKIRARISSEQAAPLALGELGDFDSLDDDTLLEEEPAPLSIDSLDAVERCIACAESIEVDSKALKLLEAISFLFEQSSAPDSCRNEKILIFTESRRTQDYLKDFLLEHGISSVVKFNGTNDDAESRAIYESWLAENEDSIDRSAARSVLARSAIIDHFRSTADIMIATEAGAEGLNLQFCSMMINYDLPWNPQRIEQRVGRCHRYGQKNDVIVVNFLDQTNLIDQRVYELLSTKFSLFNDVFGSSDEVLGNLESAENLEAKLFEIYRTCRTPEEINQAFDALQEAFRSDIDESIMRARRALIDNFDEEIQEKFELTERVVGAVLERGQRNIWRLLSYALADFAEFDPSREGLRLLRQYKTSQPGVYSFAKAGGTDSVLTLAPSHGLVREVVDEVVGLNLPVSKLDFDLSKYEYRVSELEPFVGKDGWMQLTKLSLSAFESEDVLLFNARYDDGTVLDQETCEKLFRLPSRLAELEDGVAFDEAVERDAGVNLRSCIDSFVERSNQLYQEESKRIERWADNRVESVQLKVEEMRAERRDLQSQLARASNEDAKRDAERRIASLTKSIKRSWLELAEIEDEVEAERLDALENLKISQTPKVESETVFRLRFRIV